MDPSAALRPLDEAAESIRHLEEYRTTEDLSAAVETVAAAVERSLRALLRSDRAAPDDDRLSALSPDAFPFDSVVQSLRARDRISIELAGTVHELSAARSRASAGAARASDADVGQRAAQQLRAELEALAPAPTADASDRTPAPSAPEAPAAEAAGRAADVHPPGPGNRWMVGLAVAISAVFLLGLAWVYLRGNDGTYEGAVSAFRAGRLDSAAVAFEQVLDQRPRDVSTMLYLGRIYRRQGRLDEAADVLRSAAREQPADPDIRRELGHLFMDLDQPSAAIRQYERALEQEPDEILNWAGLIRALRAAGDPRAERLLRDAPANVQAALGRPDTARPHGGS